MRSTMHRILRRLSFLLSGLVVLTTQAQIAFGGRPIGLAPTPLLPAPATVITPAVEVDALLLEDVQRIASGWKGPFRYGVHHGLDVGTDNGGTWHTLRNGDRVWRTAIECPGAFAIDVLFDRYIVPEGARVFLYNEAGYTLGAFTAASAPGRTRMATSHVPGSRLIVEYHQPASVQTEGELHISRATHAYRDVFKLAKDFGDSGDCNINVICPEGDPWRDQIRSVALIQTDGGYCTGTLLNNCAQDSTPYFLTANHCLDAGVENWVFRFNWDSPTCDPTENAPMDQTISGCTQLVNNPGTDMLFLELSSIPPPEYDVFYSGWDKSGNTPDSVCGIHHPRGDIKKISSSQSTILQANIDVGSGPADCWHITQWDAGTTEPGSSGSAVFNQNKLVIGQLYGGSAECGNSVDDYYGRLDVSWPLIEEWLGTCGDSLLGLGDGKVVPPPIYFDAAVTSIVGIPEILCGTGAISPGITLKNNGVEILNSITVTYGVQGAPTTQYVWFGSLQPGQTVNVTLPTILVSPGAHVLEVSSSLPNNNVDEVAENDLWSYAFSVSNPGAFISLLITLDNYGSDVTWNLATDTGTDLYSGGPYPDFEEGLVDTARWCLTNGCYIFTIYDEFGNGLCCDDGEGSYLITDTAGTVLAESDGQYTDENQNLFCVEVVGVPEINDAFSMIVHPNPANEFLFVQFSGADRVERLTLTDAAGRTVFSAMDMTGKDRVQLPVGAIGNGAYILQAIGKTGSAVQRVVIAH